MEIRKNIPAVKSRRDVETEIYRKSKTCKCMETTIKWTTITKDESSWPPDREIFLLEVEQISLQFLRVGSYYAADESYNYDFIDVIGKQWTPAPLPPRTRRKSLNKKNTANYSAPKKT